MTTATSTSELIEILRCPACGGELSDATDELRCAEGHRYAVVRGIPRLFEVGAISGEQQRTADAFGYSWTHYPKENPYTEEQWRDWIEPLGRDDFAGKRVLDAGCGLAGFAEYARDWGAARVVGADLSEAIDAAHERLGDSVDLVQADLFKLPFADRSFDVVYSIGVLHHTPDPERAFAAIAKKARPGGLVFAWVYGRESNGWIVHIVDPLRKHVFARLPKWVTKWLVALPAAALLWPAVRLSRRVSSMPYGEYLRWLSERDFEFLHGVVFDHLVAPTAHYIRREEFEGWFERAGLELVSITWRNKNSWRGLGRVPG
jgi:SAM-dependent methyltransferase